MPRPMSSAMLTAITSTSLWPAIFVSMTFQTGTVYIWSGLGSITWNSQTWTGVGSFGSVSMVEEGNMVEAKGLVLSLSGIDSSLLADALQEFLSRGPVQVYLGLFDGSTSPPTLIADPLTAWSGLMDQPTIDVGGETATITIACESKLLELNVPNQLRYTQDCQQANFPGDLGFTFVAGIQEQNIAWGAHPTSSPI